MRLPTRLAAKQVGAHAWRRAQAFGDFGTHMPEALGRRRSQQAGGVLDRDFKPTCLPDFLGQGPA